MTQVVRAGAAPGGLKSFSSYCTPALRSSSSDDRRLRGHKNQIVGRRDGGKSPAPVLSLFNHRLASRAAINFACIIIFSKAWFPDDPCSFPAFHRRMGFEVTCILPWMRLHSDNSTRLGLTAASKRCIILLKEVALRHMDLGGANCIHFTSPSLSSNFIC